MARRSVEWTSKGGKGALILSLLWAMGEVQAQTVYRVVDEQGRVTFTDNPDQGGEALELAPLQRVSASSASLPSRARRRVLGPPFMPYDRFEIVYPPPEARVDSVTQVDVAVSPGLRDDHQMRLRLNGEISQSALHSDAFWLANLPAGVHQLQAELLDAQGQVRHKTPIIRFQVAP